METFTEDEPKDTSAMLTVDIVEETVKAIEQKLKSPNHFDRRFCVSSFVPNDAVISSQIINRLRHSGLKVSEPQWMLKDGLVEIENKIYVSYTEPDLKSKLRGHFTRNVLNILLILITFFLVIFLITFLFYVFIIIVTPKKACGSGPK